MSRNLHMSRAQMAQMMHKVKSDPKMMEKVRKMMPAELPQIDMNKKEEVSAMITDVGDKMIDAHIPEKRRRKLKKKLKNMNKNMTEVVIDVTKQMRKEQGEKNHAQETRPSEPQSSEEKTPNQQLPSENLEAEVENAAVDLLSDKIMPFVTEQMSKHGSSFDILPDLIEDLKCQSIFHFPYTIKSEGDENVSELFECQLCQGKDIGEWCDEKKEIQASLDLQFDAETSMYNILSAKDTSMCVKHMACKHMYHTRCYYAWLEETEEEDYKKDFNLCAACSKSP